MSSYEHVQGSIFRRILKWERLHVLRAPLLRKKQAFRRHAKKARFRPPRMTPVPLHRPLTLVSKQNGISTFSFSQSTDRVPLTSKYIHVYNSSSWVQNWKQNWNSCPFSIFMIKTSFTLFFIKENDPKIEIFEKIFLIINRCILTFSLEETLDLAPILLLRPKFQKKMRKIRSKNSSQNRKIRKNQFFQNFFLYLLLPQTNHFRYRNARSHRPVLETEGKLENFVDTEENEPTKVAKKNSWFFKFLLFSLVSLLEFEH